MTDLQKALAGFVVMSVELDVIFRALNIGKVPDAWAKVSYPSLKPLGSYVADFLERLKHLKRWSVVETGGGGGLEGL